MPRFDRLVPLGLVVALTGGLAAAPPSGDVADDGIAPLVLTWTAPATAHRGPAPRRDPLGPAGGDVTFVSVDGSPEADMPRAVTYTPDGAQVLVAHRDTDNVVFYDAATFAVLGTTNVGDFPVDVAVTPDGQRAVVPNVFGDTVSIIDVATRTVEATVAVTGTEPFRVAITPDSALAVVSVINDGVASAFSVIDLDLHAEVRSIPTSGQGSIGFFFTPETGIFGNIFTQFALTPDGSTVLLPDGVDAAVRFYDVATGVETDTVFAPALPRSIDISADGSTAVIGHEGATRAISVIDVPGAGLVDFWTTADNIVNQTIRITPDESHAIAATFNNVIFVNLATGVTAATVNTGTVGEIEISSDGQYAFVTNFTSRVIDIATRSEVAAISAGPCVEGAVSPVANRAVALNNRFRENVHFYDIDGAAGALLNIRASGPEPEGDSPGSIAVSADGTVAVVGNNVSGNATIVDLTTDTVRAWVDIGDRVRAVAITPDGTHAVVCGMDGNVVGIVDLGTDTLVASLPISTRPGRVRIAPDSSEAYVLNIAGTDRVNFIELAGAGSSIVAQVSAGQTGAANGPTFTELSGIELSADGTVLAVCDSFNDLLRLYDTAARTQLAAVPTGDFPIRVAFAPDGSRAYVTNHFGNSLSVIDVDGPASNLITTIAGVGDFPLAVTVDDAHGFVYVGGRSGGVDGTIRVVEVPSNTIVHTIPLTGASPRDSTFSAVDDRLLVLTTDARLLRIEATGPTASILDETALTGGSAEIAWHAASETAVLPMPIQDGADVVRFGAACVGDVTGDGSVGFADILDILTAWGPCPPPCPEDVDGNGTVGFSDILDVLTNWGPCT